MKKVYVIGHRNPDTDSICSAIAYANLKIRWKGMDTKHIVPEISMVKQDMFSIHLESKILNMLVM